MFGGEDAVEQSQFCKL